MRNTKNGSDISLIVVEELHDKDLAAEYDGVFLDDDLEKKYPKAPKEFIYQWFFLQKPLTSVVAGSRTARDQHMTGGTSGGVMQWSDTFEVTVENC